MMQVSAELRWFWHDEPRELKAWFLDAGLHGASAGGGGTRTDEYLGDAGQEELGLKRRGGKPGVEIKGLVDVLQDEANSPPFVGAIEVWTKWTSATLRLPDKIIAVHKQRWLRTFDTGGRTPRELPLDAREQPVGGRAQPEHGCNVELTCIRLAGDVWWTLGFEAFGQLRTVENNLRAVAAMLAARNPPQLPAGRRAGYPAWLSETTNTRE